MGIGAGPLCCKFEIWWLWMHTSAVVRIHNVCPYMYVCVYQLYMYICVCMPACTHTRAHTHKHTHTHTHTDHLTRHSHFINQQTNMYHLLIIMAIDLRDAVTIQQTCLSVELRICPFLVSSSIYIYCQREREPESSYLFFFFFNELGKLKQIINYSASVRANCTHYLRHSSRVSLRPEYTQTIEARSSIDQTCSVCVYGCRRRDGGERQRTHILCLDLMNLCQQHEDHSNSKYRNNYHQQTSQVGVCVCVCVCVLLVLLCVFCFSGREQGARSFKGPWLSQRDHGFLKACCIQPEEDTKMLTASYHRYIFYTELM